MVETQKIIDVLKIDSYPDLRSAEVGQIISIKGKNPELIIDPFVEYSDWGFFSEDKYNKDKIYTVGVEENFLVQNQYDNCLSDSDEFLIPYFKISCRIGSGTALEEALERVVKKGGLKNVR